MAQTASPLRNLTVGKMYPQTIQTTQAVAIPPKKPSRKVLRHKRCVEEVRSNEAQQCVAGPKWPRPRSANRQEWENRGDDQHLAWQVKEQHWRCCKEQQHKGHAGTPVYLGRVFEAKDQLVPAFCENRETGPRFTSNISRHTFRLGVSQTPLQIHGNAPLRHQINDVERNAGSKGRWPGVANKLSCTHCTGPAAVLGAACAATSSSRTKATECACCI